MSRQLNRSVVAGGVVYPAGTSATPELEDLVPAKFWSRASDDAPEPDQEPRKSGVGPVDYEALHIPDLESEIEKRNADRDPDGERYITVGGKGNKPDLIAALVADDKAK